ncbi:hypothetical protein PM082_002289 [Marasmius tenuissimus]|nr:hypothetical protein PM082_002289 [Marasmius tenuissimus]
MPASADGNVIAVTKRLAVSERLSADQFGDLEAFLKDSNLGRQGRLFIKLSAIESKLDAVVTTQEAWKVSEGLKIRASAYEEISSQVWTLLPCPCCRNIIELAQKMVKGTQCHVTPELCARIAVFRYAYKAHYDRNEADYWGRVNRTLQEMRTKGKNDKSKIAKLVKKVLTKDRSDYGLQDAYNMPERVLPSAIQTDMDQKIEAANGLEDIDDDSDSIDSEQQVPDGEAQTPTVDGEQDESVGANDANGSGAE